MNENDFCSIYYQLKYTLEQFFQQHGMGQTLFLQQLMLEAYLQAHRDSIISTDTILQLSTPQQTGVVNVESNTSDNHNTETNATGVENAESSGN